MSIFKRKKQEPEKKIEVRCKCREEKIEVEASKVEGAPSGYRGRYTFYTNCPFCKKMIYIDEDKVPNERRKALYNRDIWS